MTTYGTSLPDDLCLSISDTPHRFDIVRVGGPTANTASVTRQNLSTEAIPSVPDDILAEVWSCPSLLYRKLSVDLFAVG